MSKHFLPLLRALVSTNQAFERYANEHIKSLGLTMPQFDVLATLGNHEFMTCKELGEKTLTTKGTLTGIMDRLRQKGLLWRDTCPEDSRRVRVGLTETGHELFRSSFEAHMLHLEAVFQKITPDDQVIALNGLLSLKKIFEK